MLRDNATSLISSPVVVVFILICLGVIFFIQARICWSRKGGRVPYRSVSFSKIYNEARLEHLQNDLRREAELRSSFDASARFGSTRPYHDTALPFESGRRRFAPEHPDTEQRYGPFTSARRSPSYGPSWSASEMSFGRGYFDASPYEARKYDVERSVPRQGDSVEYGAISTNNLALRLYEKLRISNKIINWVEKIKHWMASNRIPLILAGHSQNLSQLNKILIPYRREITFDRADRFKYKGESRPLFFDDLYDSVILNKYSLKELLSMENFSFAYKTEATLKSEVLEKRMELERTFRVGDFPPVQRDYVIDRLKTLQVNFTEYNNNGGSSLWNSSLPKDSDVLLLLL
eukprot:TRINITY_DN3049_c0_g2_i15.p1 TRINITY_DN3049_c0_g2~~TRINITY_DN3049_c0_g2_i15.p1  ORF type:complete len:347 (-),score=72.53 TRINITY_DN3049_c0_g2_i15:361-1401(-)